MILFDGGTSFCILAWEGDIARCKCTMLPPLADTLCGWKQAKHHHSNCKLSCDHTALMLAHLIMALLLVTQVWQAEGVPTGIPWIPAS